MPGISVTGNQCSIAAAASSSTNTAIMSFPKSTQPLTAASWRAMRRKAMRPPIRNAGIPVIKASVRL